ncbi:AAA family ATPase [Larkinella punicea]|nr:AAA family ATPase [Larkinella punicea]
MTPRVWFKSISLENVRSFGRKETINFTKDGNAAQWNVILGDNGTGKTTVLRSACLFIVRRYKSHNIHIDLNSFFRNNKSSEIECNLEETNTGDSYNSKLNISNLQIGDKKKIYPATHFPNEPNLVKYSEDKIPVLYAYGAARKISDGAISKDNQQIESIFNDDIELINAEEWIVQADYLALKDGRFSTKYQTVKRILLQLFNSEISDIYINTDSGTPKVYFKTNYGNVRLHELSLGYKTLIAWTVDFAKGLSDRYPDSENPLAEPAICLVDEIDLHLHPKFQRNIIQFLTETFPNTQFIVTAHSPLIVQSAGDANIILLKRVGDEVHVENDPVDVRNWRLDQILSSELFGIEDKTLQMRRERDKLLGKNVLSEQEQNRLLELNAELDSVPFSSDPAEMKAETIIHQLAEALRDRM